MANDDTRWLQFGGFTAMYADRREVPIPNVECKEYGLLIGMLDYLGANGVKAEQKKVLHTLIDASTSYASRLLKHPDQITNKTLDKICDNAQAYLLDKALSGRTADKNETESFIPLEKKEVEKLDREYIRPLYQMTAEREAGRDRLNRIKVREAADNLNTPSISMLAKFVELLQEVEEYDRIKSAMGSGEIDEDGLAQVSREGRMVLEQLGLLDSPDWDNDIT